MRLYSKEQLKDSRIFFDKQPPIFGTMLIVFMGILLVFSFWISGKLIKPYIVRAQGIASTTDIQYISANINGTVIEVLVEEGESVEEGQALFIVTSGEEDLQIEAIQSQLETAYEKLDIMNKYQKSIGEKTNYMKNSGLEQEYYGYIEYYLSRLQGENYSSDQLNNNLKEKNNKLNNVNKEIKLIEMDLKRLNVSTNVSKELRDLQKNINELEANILELQSNLEDVEVPEEIKEQEILIDKKERELKRYKEDLETIEDKEEEKSLLDGQLDSKKNEKDSLNEEIKSLKEQINDPTSDGDQMKSQLLMELGKARTAIKTQITELESNLNLNISQKDIFTVEAESDGIIHYLNPIRIGLPIQQGQAIAEVSTLEQENLIIEAYINASDISKVSINDKVNVAISGVNTSKYGTIKGKVVSIDTGTINQESQEGNILLYGTKISINDHELSSKKDKIKLIPSMPVEARIVYEEETYLEWILEMINFKN